MPQTIDLSRFADEAARDDAPALCPGDVVFVPRAAHTISILGAVTEPGDYAVRGPISALEALHLARRAVKGADLSAAIVVRRDGTVTAVDLGKPSEADDSALLMPGDALVVPRRE